MSIKREMSKYIADLSQKANYHQVSIEMLLERYNVQPVGTGYIDLILSTDKAILLIEEFTNLTVAVEALSWWCLYTPESAKELGCPHGMGGPLNKFGKGTFSECTHYPFFEISDQPSFEKSKGNTLSFVEWANESAISYVRNILPTESFYSSCLHIGLWLCVPREWKRLKYFV